MQEDCQRNCIDIKHIGQAHVGGALKSVQAINITPDELYTAALRFGFTIFLGSTPNNSIVGACQQETDRHDTQVVFNILQK